MSLQGGADRRRQVTDRRGAMAVISLQKQPGGPKAAVSEGPIRQPFPCGSGRISGQIGKARPPVVWLNGWGDGADELSNARPEMRLAGAWLCNVLLSAAAAAQQPSEAPF